MSLRKLGASLGLFALAVTSQAAIWTLSTTLSGGEEVPPNGSPATGTFTGTYDTNTNTLNYTLTVNNLMSGVTAAHVHGPAPAGSNAGVLIGLSVVSGATSFSVSSSAVASSSNAATFESLLQVGTINAYINVHTQGIPGGEVRGQLQAVPEPATMLALAPAALWALRRRRRS
jgi:hypothetical protein